MASIPNANALAVATRLYSLAPTPRTLGSRVWATASASSQVPAITAGTTAASSGVVRAAVIHGMPAARAASTTAATMTVSDTWRRTRYRQAHRAPESLGSLRRGFLTVRRGFRDGGRRHSQPAAGRRGQMPTRHLGHGRIRATKEGRGRAEGCSGRVVIG